MVRVQNKIAWGLVVALSLLVLAAMAGVVRGGPLDPTAPPGSTGKNVITSLPFTISQSGSYVLNGNLTAAASGNGITVNANNVTIDLQGFELVGASLGSSAINSSQSSLTVRNGAIRDWTGTAVLANADSVIDGLRLAGNGSGIALGARASVSNCDVQGSTSSNGILVSIASVVSKCTVSQNSGHGVSVGDDSTVSDTVARSNGGAEIVGGNRVTLENCVADGNGSADDGIRVGTNGTIRGCAASNNGGVEILAGAGSTLESCTADGAGTNGKGIDVGAGSTIRGCTARANGATGFSGNPEISAGENSTLENCVADGAGTWGNGIQVGANSIVSGCSSKNNFGDGIAILAGQGARLENCTVMVSNAGINVGADSTVRGCSVIGGAPTFVAGDGSVIENCIVQGGSGYGITIGNDSVVRGCNLRGNSSGGIHATGQLNRIEGNRVYTNGSGAPGTGGIVVDGGVNQCIQNTAGFNNPVNYVIAANNFCVTVNGTAGQTNPFANIQ